MQGAVGYPKQCRHNLLRHLVFVLDLLCGTHRQYLSTPAIAGEGMMVGLVAQPGGPQEEALVGPAGLLDLDFAVERDKEFPELTHLRDGYAVSEQFPVLSDEHVGVDAQPQTLQGLKPFGVAERRQ